MSDQITPHQDQRAIETIPGGARATVLPPAEAASPGLLELAAEAIRRDAQRDPHLYLLRSDTQQHGE